MIAAYQADPKVIILVGTQVSDNTPYLHVAYMKYNSESRDVVKAYAIVEVTFLTKEPRVSIW